jgi:hypothetical protein
VTLKEILTVLVRNATVSVPFAGEALGEMSKNASYDAAAAGKLGVKVHECGGKLRCASVEVLRKLGYTDELIALLIERGVIEQEAEKFSVSNEAA